MAEPIKTKTLSKKTLRSAFLVVSFLAIFAAGLITGYGFNRTSQELDLSKFWKVYNLAKDNFVDDINSTSATEGAIRGMVESLGDDYSMYLTKEENDSLNEELSGEFEGIGAELTDKDGQIVVVAPISSSPAESVGIKAGDIITYVDDKSTEGMTVSEAVKLIRGAKGTKVKITIVRGSNYDEQTFEITRDKITVKSVEYKMIGQVGYVQITQFGDDTVGLAEAAIKDIAKQNPKAVIIDLRNNPGGYLNAVAPIAGMFITPSVVVKEKYRLGKTDEISSTSLPVLPNVSLYILTNGGSASAAEILAGCLQDYGRAKLVGQKTFGKGSVQNIIDLSDGSALKITIAEWLTPKDRAINKVGIEPDVKVDTDKVAGSDNDPILNKALELINQ